MFKIVGRLRCPVCSEPVQPDEKVFLDIINLTFRTLPTKIGRIFSSRCRIGPWYTRKAKEFPHHGRSNSCYL
ncbi:hypothetical protein ETC01_17330, partial [Geobacillus sp. NFOSA3]|nr:hypothetical protein [Geobacillus sp. NFOSA3]